MSDVRKTAVPIGEQHRGAQDLLARCELDLDAAIEAHSGRDIARLRHDRMVLKAICATLGWLASDREGCVQFLTTRFVDDSR